MVEDRRGAKARTETTAARPGSDAGPYAEAYIRLLEIAQGLLRCERRDHTLEPAALVHEVFLRLTQAGAGEPEDGTFLALAVRSMRRVLVDHARKHRSRKRRGAFQRVTLHDFPDEQALDEADVLALDEALERLERLSERQARVVELRFFGGLSVAETATLLGFSERTIKGDWVFARAWLERELRP